MVLLHTSTPIAATVHRLPPLDLATLFTSWRLDGTTLAAVVVIGGWYLTATTRLAKNGRSIATVRRWAFLGGLFLWVVMAMSFVGVYDDELFWVRALQVILLLMTVPFLLATGLPVTVLRESLGQVGRARVDRVLASRAARIVTAPPTTSVLILATPWVLYLTPWYPAALDSDLVDQLTRLALVVIGFGYFYSRLQADPVPRKYPQLIAIAITFVEVIFDATLGVVLWIGPLRAAEHYEAFARTWGPSIRIDQTIGAGVIWLLGDVIGLPFLFALLRSLTNDERAAAEIMDAHLDAEAEAEAEDSAGGGSPRAMWWETDPQLADRFHRR